MASDSKQITESLAYMIKTGGFSYSNKEIRAGDVITHKPTGVQVIVDEHTTLTHLFTLLIEAARKVK